jgi:hypothetical protein
MVTRRSLIKYLLYVITIVVVFAAPIVPLAVASNHLVGTLLQSSSAALQLKPNRVLVIASTQMRDDYVIYNAWDFGDIIALLKLWGIPFDILRLDTHAMTINDFIDGSGNAKYSTIIWTVARQAEMPWQLQDFAIVTQAVNTYHLSFIAIGNKIQESAIQSLLGLTYNNFTAISDPVVVSSTPHFITRGFERMTIAASEAFNGGGPMVTVAAPGVTTLVTAGTWPQLTVRTVDANSRTYAVWIGGHPDNVFHASPTFIKLFQRAVVWTQGYGLYKDYGKSVVLRMDDPGGAQTAYLTSWHYPQLSQLTIQNSVIAPLQAHNAKLGVGFNPGFPWIPTHSITHSVLLDFVDPYGTRQNIVSTYAGMLDGIQAGVIEVQSHGLTHMVSDLDTPIPGSTNWWNGSTTVEWPEVGWYREFYDTRRGAEVPAAIQQSRFVQSANWIQQDFGTRPLIFIPGGHAISGDSYTSGYTSGGSATITFTLQGATANSSYTTYYGNSTLGWVTFGSFTTNASGNGQLVAAVPSGVIGTSGGYFNVNRSGDGTQFIGGPATSALGYNFSFNLRDYTQMTPEERAQFFLANETLQSGSVVATGSATGTYTPPHVSPNYTYKIAGENGYGLALDTSSHYLGPDYVVSLPVCVTGEFQGNFARGVPAVYYFHDLDIYSNSNYLASLLNGIDADAHYLSMDEWSGYLHAQLNATAPTTDSLRLGFTYDNYYARYFGTHPSAWTLHLSDEVRQDLQSWGGVAIVVDGAVVGTNDAASYFREKQTLTVPAGNGTHTILFRAEPVVTYTLSVSKTGSGIGTVTSSPARIDCGGTCSADFNANTVVHLTAVASTGSIFTGWGGLCVGMGECIVTMDTSKNVTAGFTLNRYTLNVTKTGSGSGMVTSTPGGIDCGATCSAAYDYNTVVHLTAVADTGFTFAGWSGACSGTGECIVTMDGSKIITARMNLPPEAVQVHLKPSRVLVVVGTQMRDNYVIHNAWDFGDIAALLKLWGVPFDILRLDTHSMALSDFVDGSGNAKYGTIIWINASQNEIAWQPQDYTILTQAVTDYHISLIGLANKIQIPAVQSLLGLSYNNFGTITSAMAISAAPHFITRGLAGTSAPASEAFPNGGPQVTVAMPDVTSLATAGTWPQLTARTIDADSRTKAVWIGGDPDNVFHTSPTFITLLKRALVWTQGYAVYKDYGRSVVLRMDDPGTATTSYLSSWHYPQLSQSMIQNNFIVPLQQHNAKLGVMFDPGFPWIPTHEITHSVLINFTDPFGTPQNIVSTAAGMRDGMAAGVIEVQSHGLTHMVPDLDTPIAGSANWWNGTIDGEWANVNWYREFYDTRRGTEIDAATQQARLQQSSEWILQDFGARPLAFVPGGHAISGDRYVSGGSTSAAGITLTLIGAQLANHSYHAWWGAPPSGPWTDLGPIYTDGNGNGQAVYAANLSGGGVGWYFMVNDPTGGGTQFIGGPATPSGNYSYPLRAKSEMTAQEQSWFYNAGQTLQGGNVVGWSSTNYTPPHIAENYTYKLAGQTSYGLALDTSSHYLGTDYVVSLPICVTGDYAGNFARGVPAVQYFHDLDYSGGGSLAGLLNGIESSYPGVSYLTMDEWTGYMHAQLNATAPTVHSAQFSFTYDNYYARYFGNHTSTWTLHLCDELLNDLGALGTINIVLDGAVTGTTDASTYFTEKQALNIPQGTGTHTLRFQSAQDTPPPPLPSRFYGEIHISDPVLQAGDLVQVHIAGVSRVITTAITSPVVDTLAYQIDVPGDVSGTPEKEGGAEGDVITFTIGSRIVATANWHSGTNTRLDFHSHSVTLQPGWNLVSFSLRPVSTAITDVLSSLAGHYDLAYAWNAPGQDWLKYDDIAMSTDTLSRVDETLGFWIHITTTAHSLTVYGQVPATTEITLSGAGSGWNLVGYPSQATRALPGALGSVPFSLVYAYHADDADPWKLFDHNGPPFVNDLSVLSPGWGYWIQTPITNTWTIAYP